MPNIAIAAMCVLVTLFLFYKARYRPRAWQTNVIKRDFRFRDEDVIEGEWEVKKQ